MCLLLDLMHWPIIELNGQVCFSLNALAYYWTVSGLNVLVYLCTTIGLNAVVYASFYALASY